MSNNVIMIIISSVVLSGIIFLVYYVINNQRRDNFKVDDSWKCIEGQCIKDINNAYNNIKGYDSEAKCKSDTNTQCGMKNTAKLIINTPPPQTNPPPPPPPPPTNSITVEDNTVYVKHEPIIIRGPPPKDNVLPPELQFLEGQKVNMLEEGFPSKEINTRPQQPQQVQRAPQQQQVQRAPQQQQKKTIPSKVSR